MLRAAFGAAAATVTAGTLLKRDPETASAHTATDNISVNTVSAHYVQGYQHGDGVGVRGEVTSPNQGAILGRNHGAGYAVWGDSSNNTGTGVLGTGANGVVGESSTAGRAATYGNHAGAGYGVVGDTTSGETTSGVLGRHRGSGTGVHGTGAIGVKGESGLSGYGALYGNHTGTDGFGVVGDANGNAEVSGGVLGRNSGLGPGVKGKGGIGVIGESTRPVYYAVYGAHRGTDGYGVVGIATGKAGSSGGVAGHNYYTGPGVQGRSINNDGDGVLGEGKQGVHGKSFTAGGNAVWGQASGEARGVAGTSPGGYGGFFQGGKAQIRLVPATITGRPRTGTHEIRELFLDKVGTLYICTATGTPGTWKRVNITSA